MDSTAYPRPFLFPVLCAWLVACAAAGAEDPGRWQLLLVHQDDTPGKVHLAFLRDGRSGLTSHFRAGDTLFGTEWTVSAIGSGNVELKDPAGAAHVLLPAPLPAAARVKPEPLAPPAPAKPVLPAVPPAPERTASGEPASGAVVRTGKAAFPGGRTVPRVRVVRHDDDLGVDVVEYDPGALEARYAVSDQDLKKLQDARLRLLAQVILEPGKDAAGKTIGLRVGFAVPAPLVRLLGIKDGDVLTAVEGTPVQSLDQAMAIYDRMASHTRRLRVEVLREGRTSVVSLEMDDYPDLKGP